MSVVIVSQCRVCGVEANGQTFCARHWRGTPEKLRMALVAAQSRMLVATEGTITFGEPTPEWNAALSAIRVFWGK